MRRDEVEAHAQRLFAETPPTALMAEEIERRVAQSAHAGADAHMDTLRVEAVPSERESTGSDALGEVYGSALRDASELSPELLLPLPRALDASPAHLLTPFPLCVEAPCLSPAFASRELLTAILDRAGSASQSELRVS